MKYSALVEHKNGKIEKYNIELEPVVDTPISAAIQKPNKYDQELADIIKLALESTKLEYDHSFRRAERLDNKAYILLFVGLSL